jgi:hypothetical protein
MKSTLSGLTKFSAQYGVVFWKSLAAEKATAHKSLNFPCVKVFVARKFAICHWSFVICHWSLVIRH